MQSELKWALGLCMALLFIISGCDRPDSEPDRSQAEEKTSAVAVQLNWLHDPTFAAQYQLRTSQSLQVTVKEGGPNVSPLAEVLAGRAQFAIVGSDIFLKYLGENLSTPGTSELVCVFVDFQRNPVGWVLHPDVAHGLGLNGDTESSGALTNKWIADQIRKGQITVGDKRGTESTAVWLQWCQKQSLGSDVPLIPVGFDPAVVLSAPKMLYPVYLNEQPFKLSERLNADGKGNIVVVDPVLDDVRLYGNVIVTRRDFVASSPLVVETFQEEVRRAWNAVRDDPEHAASDLLTRYSGVSAATAVAQIRRTVEFVFADGAEAGEMDIRDDGMWMTTLHSLQNAGSVSSKVTADHVLKALVPPK